MFRTKKLRNHLALNQTRNALFMVGIRGTSVLITLKARVTNHKMPMATALILQGVEEVAAVLQILVKETVAEAMTMAIVLASILFN
jgi:uncharacterized membrane protein